MPNDPRRRWRASRRTQRKLRKHLGLPRPIAYKLVHAGAALTAPGEFLRRRRAARQLAAEPARLSPVPHADGYLEAGAGVIPEAASAVETCREIWQNVLADSRAAPTLRARYSKQDFLLPVMIGDSAAYHPALLAFALRSPV